MKVIIVILFRVAKIIKTHADSVPEKFQINSRQSLFKKYCPDIFQNFKCPYGLLSFNKLYSFLQK